MSEKKEVVILQCVGKKNDGSRCTREKEFPVDEAPEVWRCWQHSFNDKEEMNKGGRPSKYDPDMLVKVEEWAKEGLTDYEISKRLGIGTSTLYEWKDKFPEFSEALKKSKVQADFRVEDSLFKRANGYKYEQITEERNEEDELVITKIVTKEVKPDTTAAIFWLKNREPDRWRDKKDIELDGSMNHTVDYSYMSDEELEEELEKIRDKG